MTEAAFWFVQTVQAKRYVRSTSLGDVWDDPVDVAAWVEDGNHLIRDSEGQEVVSSAVVYAATENAALLAPKSTVLIPGRDDPARVISLERFDSGTLGLELDHVVAHLL